MNKKIWKLEFDGDAIVEYDTKNGRTYTTWDCTEVLDYITNLQQELEQVQELALEHQKINGELREENKELEKGFCKLAVKCNAGECDCTNEEYYSMTQKNMKMYLELENYKDRIDNTIKYIREHMRKDAEYPGYVEMLIEERNNLLNILKGEE